MYCSSVAFYSSTTLWMFLCHTHKYTHTHTHTHPHSLTQSASDLTSGNTLTDSSNPLYNSASIAYFPPQHLTAHPSVKDTQMSVDPTLASSPQAHSLPYVEMQSAGFAQTGVVMSRSLGDLVESVDYEDVVRKTSLTLPPGGFS